MRGEGLRFSRRLRAWFYGVFGLLFLSGLGWLALHLCSKRTDPDAAPSPAEPWLMKLHGAAAMATLVILGILIPIHIARGWNSGQNRKAGILVVSVCAALAVTGYALYYSGNETLRDASALSHDALGLLVPAALVWHVAAGQRSRSHRKDR